MAVKALLGLISRPILDLAFLSKTNVIKRNKKKIVRESRYS